MLRRMSPRLRQSTRAHRCTTGNRTTWLAISTSLLHKLQKKENALARKNFNKVAEWLWAGVAGLLGSRWPLRWPLEMAEKRGPLKAHMQPLANDINCMWSPSRLLLFMVPLNDCIHIEMARHCQGISAADEWNPIWRSYATARVLKCYYKMFKL